MPPECGQGARGFPQPRRLLLSARGVRSACRGLCSPRSALPSQPAALPPARCAPGRRTGLGRRRRPGPRLGGQLFGGETMRAALCCPLQSAPSTRAEAESPRTPRLSYGSELKWAGKRRVAQGSVAFEFARPMWAWSQCHLEVQVWESFSSSRGFGQFVCGPHPLAIPTGVLSGVIGTFLLSWPQWDGTDRAESPTGKVQSEPQCDLTLSSLSFSLPLCPCSLFRLALYVYEYLLHVGAQKSAQTFLSEVSGTPQHPVS